MDTFFRRWQVEIENPGRACSPTGGARWGGGALGQIKSGEKKAQSQTKRQPSNACNNKALGGGA